jgi:hypothetical protein
MSKTLLAIGLAVGAMFALPGAASAQTATQDSVTGTASFENPVIQRKVTDVFNVFSGPSGENATGTVTGTVAGSGITIVTDVTCLAVSGNRAVIGLRARPPDVFNVYLVVVDGGASGQDSFGPVASPGGVATDCASVTTNPSLTPFTGGNVVVTDAPPLPTSKEQCKSGGWNGFGFRNEGQCVAFVERGPKH